MGKSNVLSYKKVSTVILALEVQIKYIKYKK